MHMIYLSEFHVRCVEIEHQYNFKCPKCKDQTHRGKFVNKEICGDHIGRGVIKSDKALKSVELYRVF